jgi:purine-binding chemotaxis protein CheW
VGLIVNEAKEVITISPEDIEASPATGLNGALPPQFATRVAKGGGKIVTVLNHVNLLQDESLREKVVLEEVPESTAARNYFCPEASPEEQAIFRDRARRLMEAPVDEGFAGLIPTAVVGLTGEYFGVDLELVRRFADLRDIVPIPCCPGHIVGNMNLRGNILTLVDVRTLLDLPGAAVNQDSKVMVASLGDLAAGVVVDQVFDIIYLNPADIGPVPTAIQKAGEKYLKGTTPYGGKVMAILNLSNLLASENLLVAEEV